MQKQLMEIYQRLYSYFGPRNWWPADTSFEVIIGAILTQNVAWRSAAAAIANLRSEGLLDAGAILGCDQESLARFLRPARYHRQKARKLQVFCRLLVEDYGGDLQALFNKDTWALRQELLKLYGIGPETADAILLYAAEKPVFVIDAYTMRIFQRLGYFPEKISYEKMQEFFMEHLPPEEKLYNEYHAQIDALGHYLCAKKKPRCSECPLYDICFWPEQQEKKSPEN